MLKISMNIIKQPIFQLPLRLFYLLASLSAILVPMWIVCRMVNGYPFYGRLFKVVTWHGYEMFFGFGIALIAGFLLTAGGAWTGKGAVRGWPLLILAILWSIERFCMFAAVNPKIAAISSILTGLYFLYISINLLMGYRVFKLFAVLLSMFFVARVLYIADGLNLLSHGVQYGETLIVNSMRFLIIIICGRIIPNFSNNKIKGLNIDVPLMANNFALGSALLMIPVTLIFKEINVHAISVMTIITCAAQVLRFYYWKPIKSSSEPMLVILNLGFLWIILSLFLEALLPYYPELGAGRATLHAFAAGAVGSIGMAIMTRSGLGHTGRPIIMDKMIFLMMLFIHVGALLRVMVPIFKTDFYMTSLHISMGIWTSSFIFFAIRFLPVFFTKRPDGKKG